MNVDIFSLKNKSKIPWKKITEKYQTFSLLTNYQPKGNENTEWNTQIKSQYIPSLSQPKTMCQIQYLKKFMEWFSTILYLTAQEMILCCTEWLLPL